MEEFGEQLKKKAPRLKEQKLSIDSFSFFCARVNDGLGSAGEKCTLLNILFLFLGIFVAASKREEMETKHKVMITCKHHFEILLKAIRILHLPGTALIGDVAVEFHLKNSGEDCFRHD